MIELLTIIKDALLNSDDLTALLDSFTWDNGSTAAIFTGQAPPEFAGRYVVYNLAENPHYEESSRKKLEVTFNYYDDTQDAANAISVFREIEKIIGGLAGTMVTGTFIRAYLDSGPGEIPEETGQHWAAVFIFEYSINELL